MIFSPQGPLYKFWGNGLKNLEFKQYSKIRIWTPPFGFINGQKVKVWTCEIQQSIRMISLLCSIAVLKKSLNNYFYKYTPIFFKPFLEQIVEGVKVFTVWECLWMNNFRYESTCEIFGDFFLFISEVYFKLNFHKTEKTLLYIIKIYT